MNRMHAPPAIRTRTSWRRLAGQTFQAIVGDNCVGLAAQLAFHFLLALFPALLFLIAFLSYLPVDRALAEVFATLGTVAPRALITVLTEQTARIMDGDHAGLLTVGAAGALWSGSAGMAAIIDALNRAYDVAEWRPWWRRRLVAIALTIALAASIVLSFALLLVGPALAGRLAAWLGLEPIAAYAWNLVRWPAIILFVMMATNLIYYFGPNRRHRRWAWMTPGAVVATLSWIGASLLFKVYLVNFGGYTATYGAIGGVIVMMLWFYISGLAMLVGAELNGVIERQSLH